jgi:hypothetical protein
VQLASGQSQFALGPAINIVTAVYASHPCMPSHKTARAASVDRLTARLASGLTFGDAICETPETSRLVAIVEACARASVASDGKQRDDAVALLRGAESLSSRPEVSCEIATP